MKSNVGLYDTFKDKEGKRYRVIEVGNDTAKLVRLNEDGSRKKQGGRPRILTIEDLFANYNRVDLPPVTVTRQEPKGIKKEPEEDQPTPLPESIRENVEIIQQVKDAGQDIEILKAELKDRIRENIDLKKTISKMQQAHEAEVADLKDRLMEKEADANAARKRKDEILKERTQYADALDNDSVAFDEILSLAETIQWSAVTTKKLACMIQSKMEGRI